MPIPDDSSRRLQESPASRSNLPELVPMDVVAKALCVTERHLRRLVAERRIPFVKVGYFVRFDTKEVARWVETHRFEVRGERQGRLR